MIKMDQEGNYDNEVFEFRIHGHDQECILQVKHPAFSITKGEYVRIDDTEYCVIKIVLYPITQKTIIYVEVD